MEAMIETVCVITAKGKGLLRSKFDLFFAVVDGTRRRMGWQSPEEEMASPCTSSRIVFRGSGHYLLEASFI